ncbi:AAEL014140-PA [Aedes aegypti]|uniref:limulus clotting factor C n=2 Tax=Aedes aegypti TaxID=7159 RepID=A0A1S4G1J9_AEDAE|nr:melanization protease 1 isoform X2 [Aedes aegypti]EAT33588.1 AAEL014140-PA [Aedes aegypti]
MEKRSILVATIICVALNTSSAQFLPKKCSPDRKCTPFNDCADYRSYAGTSSRNWPRKVQNEVKSLMCAVEHQASGKKLYKICCLKPGRHLLDMETCGKQVTPRIAHGKVATVFQFPWMALLRGFDGKFHCGGTLIAQRYVLTATHCRRKSVYSVRLGETDLSTPIDCIKYIDGEEECAEPPQDILAEKFIKHPKYSPSQKKNDIALIKLASPALLNDNVRPICLPLEEVLGNIAQTKMLVSGWGFTENDTEFSNQLRFAYVPIVDPRQCNESLALSSNVLTVDESQLCAGGGNDKADNCQGDSGGPLKYFGNGKYVIHGVVSFGQATCGVVSEPGVYTKVEHYLEWIIDNLQ